jgi:DNA-binding NarL/FixJ family response regulator
MQIEMRDVEALRKGASGYLLKDISVGDLAQAVHRGIYQLDPAVMSRVMTSLIELKRMESQTAPSMTPVSGGATPPGSLKHAGLTERKIEVLRLIAQRATNREIAEKLVISEGTVKNHISNILS